MKGLHDEPHRNSTQTEPDRNGSSHNQSDVSMKGVAQAQPQPGSQPQPQKSMASMRGSSIVRQHSRTAAIQVVGVSLLTG